MLRTYLNRMLRELYSLKWKWLAYVSPTYKFCSRNIVKTDCIEVYNLEKAKLYSILDSLSSRVSLTMDLWTPDHQNFGRITCSLAETKDLGMEHRQEAMHDRSGQRKQQ